MVNQVVPRAELHEYTMAMAATDRGQSRRSPCAWPRRASTRRSRRRASGTRCERPSPASTSPTPTTASSSASRSTRGPRPPSAAGMTGAACPGPKRLGRPPAIDSAETRQKILARPPGARSPAGATTPPPTRTSPTTVGITTGAIYHYFASKADLYVAVYAEVQVMIYDVFEKAIVGHRLLLRTPGRRARRRGGDQPAATPPSPASWSACPTSGPATSTSASGSAGCRAAAARSSAAWSTMPSSGVSWPPDVDGRAGERHAHGGHRGLARFSTQVTTERHREAADRAQAR